MTDSAMPAVYPIISSLVVRRHNVIFQEGRSVTEARRQQTYLIAGVNGRQKTPVRRYSIGLRCLLEGQPPAAFFKSCPFSTRSFKRG